jgi:hypothetical protein
LFVSQFGLAFGRPQFADEPSVLPATPTSHGSPLRAPGHTSEQRGPAPRLCGGRLTTFGLRHASLKVADCRRGGEPDF